MWRLRCGSSLCFKSLKVNSNSGFRAAALTLGGCCVGTCPDLTCYTNIKFKICAVCCFLAPIYAVSICDGTNQGKQTCTAPQCWSEFRALVGALTTTPTTTKALEAKVEGFQKSPCFPFLSLHH